MLASHNKEREGESMFLLLSFLISSLLMSAGKQSVDSGLPADEPVYALVEPRISTSAPTAMHLPLDDSNSEYIAMNSVKVPSVTKTYKLLSPLFSALAAINRVSARKRSVDENTDTVLSTSAPTAMHLPLDDSDYMEMDSFREASAGSSYKFRSSAFAVIKSASDRDRSVDENTDTVLSTSAPTAMPLLFGNSDYMEVPRVRATSEPKTAQTRSSALVAINRVSDRDRSVDENTDTVLSTSAPPAMPLLSGDSDYIEVPRVKRASVSCSSDKLLSFAPLKELMPCPESWANSSMRWPVLEVIIEEHARRVIIWSADSLKYCEGFYREARDLLPYGNLAMKSKMFLSAMDLKIEEKIYKDVDAIEKGMKGVVAQSFWRAAFETPVSFAYPGAVKLFLVRQVYSACKVEILVQFLMKAPDESVISCMKRLLPDILKAKKQYWRVMGFPFAECVIVQKGNMPFQSDILSRMITNPTDLSKRPEISNEALILCVRKKETERRKHINLTKEKMSRHNLRLMEIRRLMKEQSPPVKSTDEQSPPVKKTDEQSSPVQNSVKYYVVQDNWMKIKHILNCIEKAKPEDWKNDAEKLLCQCALFLQSGKLLMEQYEPENWPKEPNDLKWQDCSLMAAMSERIHATPS